MPKINIFIMSVLQNVTSAMSNYQIRTMQNLLRALADALPALRSKGRNDTLNESETEAYKRFSKLYYEDLRLHINSDKDFTIKMTHLPSEASVSKKTFEYKMTRLPLEEASVSRTFEYYQKFPKKHRVETEENDPREKYTTSIRIRIVNFFSLRKED